MDYVISTKAQMKIQQMAFMIIAIAIFFSMVALIYFAITLSQLEGTAESLAEEEAMELAFAFSGTPELFFTAASADCSACIDLDKAFAMAQLNEDSGRYNSLWNIEYLQIEKIYPKPSEGECENHNYNTDRCRTITIKESSQYTAKTAIVTLASSKGPGRGYNYELGRIHVSAKNITG
jgi:hypothetical protein